MNLYKKNMLEYFRQLHLCLCLFHYFIWAYHQVNSLLNFLKIMLFFRLFFFFTHAWDWLIFPSCVTILGLGNRVNLYLFFFCFRSEKVWAYFLFQNFLYKKEAKRIELKDIIYSDSNRVRQYLRRMGFVLILGRVE